MRKAIQKRMEAKKYVWEGAIPLQIHLHESQVTTLPPPPPSLILAPRIGYLPLLVPLIKPHFSSTLPPGVDTIWFEYRGLPLKCQNQPPNGGFFCCRYIPTGVLFDLLCAEPERPWNITVHFRGYPGNVLIPCDGEDSVKWSFINSLKEAAYIINGNCKNVMNMSQSDQLELWHSVMNGNLEAYLRVSSKLKLATIEDEYTSLCSSKSQQGSGETDFTGQVKTGRVPVRLYVWSISEDFDDLEDLSQVDSWEKISYINRPIEIHKEGKCFTLHDAMKSLLPEFFSDESLSDSKLARVDFEDAQKIPSEDVSSNKVVEDQGQNAYEHREACCISSSAEIKLIRIQGIEPKLEIPFSWLVNNLLNPDHFLHICVCVKVPQ
ncbi:PREDICTED: autophagy protein 5 isoform X1 [Theobroma cacao]|uniref:Autophagy protein 5 n=1 Tax=Theobroma cacao TaxID=3641 RepID=A0AB32W8G6_THECC|nr:PREDICTED: autophagy protein 5 isoform X1 [Theobroma cacao]